MPVDCICLTCPDVLTFILHWLTQPPHPAVAAAGTLSGTLASSGILDSNRDNAFNFVDDALAAARRKH